MNVGSQASSSPSVTTRSLQDFDSPASSALQFVPASPTHSSNSSVSSISLLPPASTPASTISITAPNGECGCRDCQSQIASRSTTTATSPSSSPTPSPQSSPHRSPRRNGALFLLPTNDPWSYKSAKTRATQNPASRSAQTLPTVEEDSEYVSFFDFR